MRILYTILLNLVIYSYGMADITQFSSYAAKYEVYYKGIEAGEMIFNYQKDGNEISMNGNDNKILEIVNKGLLDSNFKPAQMGAVSVESELTLSIKIPERFCG